MTVLALVGGAVLAAASTRLSAVAFLGAAVLAATSPADTGLAGGMTGPATWIAATAAGLVLLDVVPVRRLALPALGAAAVVAAGTGRNVAVAAGAWVIASAAATLAGRIAGAGTDDGDDRTWSTAIALSDLLVIVVLGATARGGFEGWPSTLEPWAAGALLAAAAIRLPFCGTAGSPTSILIIRSQAIVLIAVATAAGGEHVATAALLAGAVAVVAAGLASRSVVMDVMQEAGLFAMASGAAAAGLTGDRDLGWGVLAAGTLIHHLRLTVGPVPAGRWAGGLLRSGGIGLPFLPVAVGLLEAAVTGRGWRAALIAMALLGGAAVRVRHEEAVVRGGRTNRRRPARPGPDALGVARGWTVVVLSITAALWAPFLASPADLRGGGDLLEPVAAWPALWAIAGLVALSVALPAELPARKGRASAPDDARRLRLPSWRTPAPIATAGTRLEAAADRATVIPVIIILQACGAAGLWIWGLTRGFL